MFLCTDPCTRIPIQYTPKHTPMNILQYTPKHTPMSILQYTPKHTPMNILQYTAKHTPMNILGHTWEIQEASLANKLTHSAEIS